MKRILMAALVGAVLLWGWQFVSYAFPNFHYPALQYTPLQDSILPYLEKLQLPEGGYVMPNVAKDDFEGGKKLMNEMPGKRWATLQYYHKHDMSMGISSLKAFLSDLVALILVGVVISGLARQKFGNVFVTTLCFGLVIFFAESYLTHVWYPKFDIWFFLLDSVAGWGIVALWMGWYFQKYPAR